MANTLTDLIPSLYQALDTVSRETTGLISAVTVNAVSANAAVGEAIRIPITGQNETFNIVSADEAPNNGDFELDHADITITKSKIYPIRWDAEQQLGFRNTGTFSKVLADQIFQGMRLLVSEVERDLAACYVSASQAYGTAGTIPFTDNSVSSVAQLRRILTDNGAPLNDLQLVLSGQAGAALRSTDNMVHANQNASNVTLRTGELLDLMGFRVREGRWMPTHSAGSFTGTAKVNKASGYAKGATSIAFDGATAANLKAGDIVTFGTDATKYVVAEDCTASPLKLNAPGLVKPVADNAVIAVGSGYDANMAFARSAIFLVARDPAMPVIDGKAIDKADSVEHLIDPVSGLAFQVASYGGYHRRRYEVGLAWGCACIKPEHVCLLLG